MASLSVPCPKTSATSIASQTNPKQQRHCSISFRSDPKSKPTLLAGSSSDHSASLRFQGSRWNQSDAFKVCAQLNEVAIEKSSNSVPFPEKESEEPAQKSESQSTIPDASSISAFMTQVADLVELVDSKDIMELQLKQLDCELLIRKKEALPQPPAPVVMMHSPPPQAMVPSQLPPQQLTSPAPVGPAPSPPVSAPALPSPAKPVSSHPPLKCPMAGTFYRCPAPGAPPFVKVGDKVQKGQVVCIIEAMKLMNEIETDQAGTIVEILVDDAKPVSVDMPLFTIEP
ncbi:biotin carboxyl carrier protein of acetyl-CoA carboxylase, chloroplastic-like [Cornus florida]|uniref:biotin carboxyl carrier protein of acetyl-CoA carboxylase, chloroplastic-like n=1 Tax=Cornus florida TaxID=4283 RepID=UPI0028A035A5|nr:biotin carboxyl carrier protein of acetyl-CoA carboxylase, chloroplastic-like [Cornus florida]